MNDVGISNKIDIGFDLLFIKHTYTYVLWTNTRGGNHYQVLVLLNYPVIYNKRNIDKPDRLMLIKPLSYNRLNFILLMDRGFLRHTHVWTCKPMTRKDGLESAYI